MPTRQYRILWLDDEPGVMASYCDAIRDEETLELRYYRRLARALEALRDDVAPPDFLIWDMILPPESFSPFTPQETEGGLRSGEQFFVEFRKRFRDVPALLFTNIRDMEILKHFDCPEERSWSRQKLDMLPSQLVRFIIDTLQS